jgi:hypothetical protein
LSTYIYLYSSFFLRKVKKKSKVASTVINIIYIKNAKVDEIKRRREKKKPIINSCFVGARKKEKKIIKKKKEVTVNDVFFW